MPKNPSVLPEDVFRNLPPLHPAGMEQQFTQLQEFAFPVLMWFFDRDRYLGTGRTTLAARVCIELAMRGREVPLEDMSAFVVGKYESQRNVFVSIVMNMTRDYYKRHRFEYRQTNGTLTYKGRNPR